MWVGDCVITEDGIEDFSREQDLLGLSTCLDYDYFNANNDNLKSKSYYKEVQFIDKNHKLWKKIKVENKALKYFNWEKTHSVKYSGYLLNHTKKLAVDLADYYEQSKGFSERKEGVVIDVVPALTETGGGTKMAMLVGNSIETTENLAGSWCGDLLQIVDNLPKKYKIINCCFSDIWYKTRYYYFTFGTDKDGYILKNSKGKRYQCVCYNAIQDRGPARYVKASKKKEGIQFATELVRKRRLSKARSQSSK